MKKEASKKPNAMSPKKSHKKLIIGIVAIIIVVILFVFFIFAGDEGKFIGTWKHTYTTTYEDGNVTGQTKDDGSKITFKENGTFTMENPTNSGTWKLKDEKICFESESLAFFPLSKCWDYKFTINDKNLEFTYTSTIEINGVNVTKKTVTSFTKA